MKKIVLAKITTGEAESIEKAERNYHTFLSLLHNAFVSDEEKNVVSTKLNELKVLSKSLYNEVLIKYNIPYETNFRYQLSVNQEIFVEVYGDEEKND